MKFTSFLYLLNDLTMNSGYDLFSMQQEAQQQDDEFPRDKDGNIDYNTLLSTNPDAYADELVKALGQQKAVDFISTKINAIDDTISKLEKRIKSELDDNKRIKSRKEIKNLKAQREVLTNQVVRIIWGQKEQITMNEAGDIDNDSLMETNPEAYADELIKTYGKRVAVTVMSSLTVLIDKKISSLEKSLKSEIDTNISINIEKEKEIAELKMKVDSISHQISRLIQVERKKVKTMNVIENNPFRILGVYSNASAKEITANVSKIKAYLKVGKKVEFPSDLNDLLPPVVRTIENVDKALSQLNLPQEKIKYALFWFIKVTPMDEVALNHLNGGDDDKCKAILEKRRTYSALLNKGLLALFDEDYDSFVNYYTEVLHSEELCDFITLVCGDNIKISEEELSHCFIDLLLDEGSDVDWMELFLDNGSSGDDDDYLTEKIVSGPIKLIEKEISKAKLANGAENRYKAGVALINNTKDCLAKLSDIIDVEDVKYQIIADKLAREILQCGIDYYNNSIDHNVAKALFLQNFAVDIAVSKMLKDRCVENLNILNQIKKNEDRENLIDGDLTYISERIKAFDSQRNSINYTKIFVTECIPHLYSLIKVLGANNNLYSNVCSAVVSRALNTIISSVNACHAKSNISNAISVMNLMNEIDMPCRLRDHFFMNKGTLSSMLEKKRKHSFFAKNPMLIILIVIAIIAIIAFISSIS